MNYVLKTISRNIYTVKPHYVQFSLLFLWKLYITILSRVIFVPVFIKESCGHVCICECSYHVATLHSNLITFLAEVLPRGILVSLFTKELHSYVHRWVYVYGCNWSHFLWKWCVRILSVDIFISVLIRELHGRVHMHEYPYCVAISNSTLVTLSVKIVCRNFIKENFCLMV
jgi:hypothetical protein